MKLLVVGHRHVFRHLGDVEMVLCIGLLVEEKGHWGTPSRLDLTRSFELLDHFYFLLVDARQ